MKIALVYNRDSRRVINLFGMPNQEIIGKKAIARILKALRAGGHQVKALEGDKDLIDKLEEFMPQALKGEKPGLVFNISYGIQGQARYTHIPSILEMIGIPYVGSGPLAHSLSLDKVVSKMIFRQNGIQTPDFFVLESLQTPLPKLDFPLIIKPKNEAVSLGIKVVNNPEELRKGARAILDKFKQPVLVEQYIEGREINIGLLGNSPVETFPPCEIVFGETGPRVYSYADKAGNSGRKITVTCPADISASLAKKAQALGLKAFQALGCYDTARVDMRLSEAGELYVLEVNSLPSLGEHGSFTHGAEKYGLDFTALVNRMVDVAYSRYFGTPVSAVGKLKSTDAETKVFRYISRRRDELEKGVHKWLSLPSRTEDQIGVSSVVHEFGRAMTEAGMKPAAEHADSQYVHLWHNSGSLDGAILLVAHADVPLASQPFHEAFRREPELILGEGVAKSKASLAMIELTLHALRSVRLIRSCPIGVVLYTDEGLCCKYSGPALRQVFSKAAAVLVLSPTGLPGSVITDHRGQRVYRFSAEGKPFSIDNRKLKTDVLIWGLKQIEHFSAMSMPRKRLSVAPLSIETTSLPMHVPHHIEADILVNFAGAQLANQVEQGMRDRMAEIHPFNCNLTRMSECLPLPSRSSNHKLAAEIIKLAARWDIKIAEHSSVWPTVAGLVPAKVPVVSGMGPFASNLFSPHEAVDRTSLVQKTLLLAAFLAHRAGRNRGVR